MRAIAARCLALALILPFSLPALALEDTPQNREVQADRYLEAIPPQAMIDELLARTADTLPAEQQEQFKTLVAKHLNRAAITAAIRAGMAKTFTAEELQALADFYGSKIGKAAMEKMQSYQQEVAPTLMNEFQSAVTKAEEEAHPQSKAPEVEKK
jgi:hypothetical protein